MTEPPTPEFNVPDQRTLLEATGIAAVIAAAVMLLFVLPAEYNIDPTRFGEAIGIKGMGAAAPVLAADASPHTSESSAFRTDSVDIQIPAGEGLEYKLIVSEGGAFVYSWSAPDALQFDFHGEPTNDTTGTFESYEKGRRAGADGSFRAPFSGTHGWYWRNSGFFPVTVTLETAGHYEIAGII